MKKTILISLFLIIINNLLAQELKMQLWDNSIPNSNGINIEEISDTTNIIMIKKVNKPSIEIFKPSSRNNSKIAAIVVPGGGYNILAYDWEGTEVAKWLNSNGITAVVLKYRLPHTKNNITGHISPFLDLQRAIRLTRTFSKELDIDKNKIGVIGFSAGGHLAATLGTHFEEDNLFTTDSIDSTSCKPDFMILLYPVITFKEPYLHRGSKYFLIGDNPAQELIDYYSCELNINSNTPATFLVHAGDDKSVPVENSLMFYKKLKENGINSEMHIYPKGGHGFSLAIGNERLSSWKELCIIWLKNLKL